MIPYARRVLRRFRSVLSLMCGCVCANNTCAPSHARDFPAVESITGSVWDALGDVERTHFLTLSCEHQRRGVPHYHFTYWNDSRTSTRLCHSSLESMQLLESMSNTSRRQSFGRC